MDTTIRKRGGAKDPARLIVYGTEGIGKTTLAASAPDPLFVPTEDGLASVPDADSFDICRSFGDVMDCLRAVYNDPQGHRTLAIDSLDWLEQLIWADTVEEGKRTKPTIDDIEDFGYAKGYIKALSRWKKFTSALDLVREKHRMTIVCIAHAKIANVRNPAGDDYNAFTPRLHEKAMGHVAEWADAVLFASRAMRTDKDTKKASGLGFEPGGDRLLTCTGSPAVTAKNRYGMPETLPLSWAALAPYLPGFATLPQPEAAPNASATGTDAGAANQNQNNN